MRALLSATQAEVLLLDLGQLLTVATADLRLAPTELFWPAVTAVPSVLAGWEQEDGARAAEEWGSKMKELVPEPFAQVEAEVVGRSSEGRCTVRVAAWEQALARKEPSKAALLLMKMKAKAK